jgi:molybdenum cofactor biosynthesis enzyme MoaA
MNNDGLLKNKGKEIRNIDRSFMMNFLLEECNFSCEHCVREDEPCLLDTNYHMSSLKKA